MDANGTRRRPSVRATLAVRTIRHIRAYGTRRFARAKNLKIPVSEMTPGQTTFRGKLMKGKEEACGLRHSDAFR